VIAERSGHRRLADAAQVPATITGAAMATYTAALLSATSNPLWAAAPGPLAAVFGASSMASAASALALLQRGAGEERSAARLERFASLALVVEHVAMRRAEARWRAAGVARALEEGPPALAHTGGAKAVGMVLPIAAALLGRPALAAVAVLAGGALMRHAMLRAGDASAMRPRDYFRVTQEAAPARRGRPAP
jgi:formate-dependent nitrite reductase membrane component NrfD